MIRECWGHLRRAVVEVIGPDQLLYGTNFGGAYDHGDLTAGIDLSEADREKIRSGKVQAAGAIVGAVMKATRGQADAAKVRELLLDRLGVQE